MKRRTIYPNHEAVSLVLPDHLADWDAWDHDHEHIRYQSVVTEMANRGGLLWEVGAEHGAQAALYAERLGGDQLVLIEPMGEFWPNMRLTWEANGFAPPAAWVHGFMAAHSTWNVMATTVGGLCRNPRDFPWPSAADDGEQPASRYIDMDSSDASRVYRLAGDDFRGIAPPGGISIDVEGHELDVLRGCHRTLTTLRPLVWVSIHPEQLAQRGYERSDVIDLMVEVGYMGELLAVDHEEHWLFRPTASW